MKIEMKIDTTVLNRQLLSSISKIGPASDKAVLEEAQQILDESLQEVPRETETLAQSAYIKVYKHGFVSSADVGYGGNGNPVNPKTNVSASDYMLAVHENLDASHPVGKAKFLEDPVRNHEATYENDISNKIGLIIRNAFKGGR